jgi:hypothetical protein
MKKIKIMLTAITVLAIVGGAFAFKAHNKMGHLYCSSVSGTAGRCCTKYSDNIFGTALYCTTTPCGVCGTTTTKVVADAK